MALLEGKTALVTGGGRGIGRGIVLSLAGCGANVLINDLGASLGGDGRDSGPAQQVLAEVEALGAKGAINGDSVAEFAAGRAMVEQAVATFGRLDIVVHAAGVLRDRMIFNMTEEEWDPVIAVHLKGLFNVLRPATALMRQQKSGRIIALASGSAYGDPGQPNYAAAKAGIIGLIYSTANAMGKYGVTANVVLPTGTTRMIDSKPGSRKIFEETGKWPSESREGHAKRSGQRGTARLLSCLRACRSHQRPGVPFARLWVHANRPAAHARPPRIRQRLVARTARRCFRRLYGERRSAAGGDALRPRRGSAVPRGMAADR